MQIPVQITFRGVPRSTEIEDLIRDRAADLEKFHHRITGCHVVVASTRRRTGNGLLYSVRVDLVVPGGEILASREHRTRPQHYEIEPAVDRAFHVARRRLEDFVRKFRGAVKQHRELPIARVSKLLPEKDGGFIETPDGREIYFHRNAILGKPFEEFALGDPVHYVEEPGEEGPNAASIRPIAHPARRMRPIAKQLRARVKR